MKNPKIIALSLFAVTWMSGQELKKELSYYIENPQVISENKEDTHATFYSFSSEEAARKKSFAETDNYLSLDGTWKFKWVRKPADRPMEFYMPSEDVSAWDDIKVPGNWEVQGFGVPIYVNHQYEFADYKAPVSPEMEFTERIYPANPGKVPHDYNPVGSYRRDFVVDESWTEKEVFLHIGAMKSGGFVWVNGQYVGYSQGSKLPAEFNIARYIKPGKNTIAIQIFRWTDGSYLECQDFWRISGIERNVYLYAQPKIRIRDVEAMATLDSSYQDGDLQLSVMLQNTTSKKAKMEVSYNIYDQYDVLVAGDNQSVQLNPSDTTTVNFASYIMNVMPWTAETPNLYKVVVSTKEKKAGLLEATAVNVGFRTVEIKNGLLKVNGQTITLKGVNTQEANPETGHYVQEDQILKDIKLWKENNINAVRLSHYPQQERFYELCDEYGIYVVDEANIESHGMYYGKYSLAKKQDWEKAHVDRMSRMVKRDRNHPSVIIWSMGNEAGNGVNFFTGYNAIKALDKQKRPVQYERAYKETDGNLFDMDSNTDIIVPQYPSPATFEAVGKFKTDRPFIPSEYAHAMGNSTGNFQDYWDVIEQHDNLQGGFIWDWVDQSIWAVNEKGQRYYAYGGDFGENMPSDDTFLNNGIVFPDRTPQPALFEVKKAHEFINFRDKGMTRANELRILIENLYDFTDLSNFEITAYIKADGKVLKKVELGSVEAAPHTGKLVRVSLDGITVQPNTEYFLEIEAALKRDAKMLKKGYVVAHEQLKLEKLTDNKAVQIEAVAQSSVKEDKESLIITGNDFSVKFDKAEGKIVSFVSSGNVLIKEGNGPKPNFWRAPTDNDFGNRMQLNNIEWKRASLEAAVSSFRVNKAKTGVVEVEVVFNLPGVETSFSSIYEVYPSGVIKVSNTLGTSEYKADIPRIGMRLQLPKDYSQMTYYGKGPWENYQDRNVSTFVDVYTSDVSDQYVPYVRPQENGYKTQVRWAALSDLNKNGLLVVSSASNHRDLGFSALHMPNEDFDATAGLSYESGKKVERSQTKDDPNYSDGMPEVNNTKHISDIVEKDLVQLNIDYDQRGVGGDDSWGSRPQKQYMLNADKPHSYSFYLIPFENGDREKFIGLYKQYYNAE